MANRRTGQPASKANAHDILQAIHAFKARTSDELSLVRGDYVELLEKDDDFGDGWYLGRHIESRSNGLFPEVYTELATQVPKHIRELVEQQPPTPEPEAQAHQDQFAAAPSQTEPLAKTGPPGPAYTESLGSDSASYQAHTPSPLNPAAAATSHRTVSAPATGFSPAVLAGGAPTQRSISLMMEKSREHGEDSPVMNETLSVIDEHITDMHTPRSSVLAGELRGDSGSEYSAYMEHRLSYINGHETDEEERGAGPTRADVLRWDPRQVAEQLSEAGVERRHCEVFREQEISGEVLLGLDQAAIFMKELELGVVGRRLRTWHKIRALQEEVQASDRSTPSRRHGPPSATSQSVSRKTSTRGSVLPKVPNLTDHANSSHETSRLRANTDTTANSRMPAPESPGRPSAASVREYNHSRRHSSLDFNSKSDGMSFGNVSKTSTPPTSPEAPHKKQPSFDRNWTMGTISPTSERTASGLGSSTLSTSASFAPSQSPNLLDPNSLEQSGGGESDRGYLSGGDIEGRKMRNVLRKNQPGSATHSRQNSANQEKASLAAPTKRHSRFSSAGSIREALSSVKSSSPKLSSDAFSKFRSKSGSMSQETSVPEDATSGSPPMVTNLEQEQSPVAMTSPRESKDSPLAPKDGPLPQSSVQNTPKSFLKDKDDLTPSAQPSVKTRTSEHETASPVRTGSTTSGATPSLEGSTESPAKPEAPTPKTGLANLGSKRVKSKTETSAYKEGLNRVPPSEALRDCDYSGWMKKRSPKMTSTWKSRLFVLKGRRLGYYYSEADATEKGVIDISSHRVLPADNEFLTGLHATLTGAKSSPTSPADARAVTMNATEMAAAGNSLDAKVNGSGGDGGSGGGGGNSGGGSSGSGESMFIFKLVPPRPGLSRAISFTRQMVHYFAVDNVQQGRLWMAALMKATIDRDESKPVSTTYSQKTISLTKAISMKQRPPALMGVEEQAELPEPRAAAAAANANANTADAGEGDAGLNIHGVAGLDASPRSTGTTGTADDDDDATPQAHPGAAEPPGSGPPSARVPGSAPLPLARALRQSTSPALAPGTFDSADDAAARAGPARHSAAAGLRLVRSLSGGLRGPPTDTAGVGAGLPPATAAAGGARATAPTTPSAEQQQHGPVEIAVPPAEGPRAERADEEGLQKGSVGQALSSLA